MHGKVIASATDSSATIATRRVSLTALDALANDPELLARICDCGSGEARKQAPKAEGMTQEEAEAAEVEGVMDAVDDEE